jgi:hypothetical protein
MCVTTCWHHMAHESAIQWQIFKATFLRLFGGHIVWPLSGGVGIIVDMHANDDGILISSHWFCDQ